MPLQKVEYEFPHEDDRIEVEASSAEEVNPPKSGEATDEYEVEVTKKGDIDDITLKVELLPEYEAEINNVQEVLNWELRIKTNLRYDLEFCKYGSLPRYETKAKRFKDLRGGEQPC